MAYEIQLEFREPAPPPSPLLVPASELNISSDILAQSKGVVILVSYLSIKERHEQIVLGLHVFDHVQYDQAQDTDRAYASMYHSVCYTRQPEPTVAYLHLLA